MNSFSKNIKKIANYAKMA